MNKSKSVALWATSVLVALAGCVSMTAAHAQFVDGNRLLQRASSESTAELMYATGYVMGVVDRLTYDEKFCPPNNLTVGQSRDIVVQWLRANPSLRHHNATLLVGAAMLDTFPCKKQAPSSSNGNL